MPICEIHHIESKYKCSQCTVDKRRATMIARYGVANALHSTEIKERKDKTCLDKYGTVNPCQHKDIKKKRIQTNLKKYGVEENGSVSIPIYTNEVIDDETKEIVSRDVNPDFVKFQNDFNGLLEEDRELEYKGFKLEEFDSVETDGNYNTIFKLIKVDE